MQNYANYEVRCKTIVYTPLTSFFFKSQIFSLELSSQASSVFRIIGFVGFAHR
jgi:hypothetical protein